MTIMTDEQRAAYQSEKRKQRLRDTPRLTSYVDGLTYARQLAKALETGATVEQRIMLVALRKRIDDRMYDVGQGGVGGG